MGTTAVAAEIVSGTCMYVTKTRSHLYQPTMQLEPKKNGHHYPDTMFSHDAVHSVRKLFTGLAIAAFTEWKLIVNSAINRAMAPAAINIHQLMSIR